MSRLAARVVWGMAIDSGAPSPTSTTTSRSSRRSHQHHRHRDDPGRFRRPGARQPRGHRARRAAARLRGAGQPHLQSDARIRVAGGGAKPHQYRLHVYMVTYFASGALGARALSSTARGDGSACAPWARRCAPPRWLRCCDRAGGLAEPLRSRRLPGMTRCVPPRDELSFQQRNASILRPGKWRRAGRFEIQKASTWAYVSRSHARGRVGLLWQSGAHERVLLARRG